MRYFFRCAKCHSAKEVEISFSEPMPESMECVCGGSMTQDYARKVGTLSLKTPESFKAGSEYAPKDYTDGGTSTDLEALGY